MDSEMKNRVWKLLWRAGLDPKRVAVLTGVDEGTLLDWLAGNAGLSDADLQRLNTIGLDWAWALSMKSGQPAISELRDFTVLAMGDHPAGVLLDLIQDLAWGDGDLPMAPIHEVVERIRDDVEVSYRELTPYGTRDLLRWTLFELFLAHRELAQLKAQGNTK